MDDYEGVRLCQCAKSELCESCWPIIKGAIVAITRVMKEDFGFVHLLWIYSGRRGVHCWICDYGARKLSDSSRKAVASYLTRDKEDITSPVALKMFNTLEPYFIDAFGKRMQAFNDSSGKWGHMSKLIKTKDLKLPIKSKATERFNTIRSNSNVYRNLVLKCMFPRIDSSVTKSMVHLLKSPFSIHPVTKNICIPIDIDRLNDFDIKKVPNIGVPIDEVFDDRMKQSIEYFRKFIKNLNGIEDDDIVMTNKQQ
jgi:DNA primase small subunit